MEKQKLEEMEKKTVFTEDDVIKILSEFFPVDFCEWRINQYKTNGINKDTYVSFNKKRNDLLAELEIKLNTSGNYKIPYHQDSIMVYEKICNHDDGYLCEHRRKYIINFVGNIITTQNI